jgi:hypothetical protein
MIKKALRECIFTNENYSDRGLLQRVATIEIDQLVPIPTSGLFTFYTRMTPGLVKSKLDRDTILKTGLT